jgi:hypothetical protein
MSAVKLDVPIKPLDEGRSEEEPLKELLPFILETSEIKGQIPSIGPVLPGTMLLGALRDPRLRLIKPLTITFERENDETIAYCEELEEFGFGTHLTEALEDLQVTIAEAYFILKEENKRLGSDLRTLWNSLREKVKEVS